AAPEVADIQLLPCTHEVPPLSDDFLRVDRVPGRLARDHHADFGQGRMPPKHCPHGATQRGLEARAVQGPAGAVVHALGKSERHGDGHVKLFDQHGSSHGPPFTSLWRAQVRAAATAAGGGVMLPLVCRVTAVSSRPSKSARAAMYTVTTSA